MSAQRNASLASAAANAASGNYVQAAANFAAALFSGSGKTPSVLQGVDIIGQYSADGFSGEVWGFDQKGNRWIGTGETEVLKSQGLGLFAAGAFAPAIEQNRLSALFAGGKKIDVAVTLPTNQNFHENATKALTDLLLINESMNAPQIESKKPAAQPAAPASKLDPVASAFAGMDQVLTLVAIAGLILYAMKES